MNNNHPFRVGLVGTGHICAFHVQALRQLPNVTIAGITDLDLGRARAVAERFGLPAPVPSLEAMVQRGLDVVHVLTPPASHAEITLRALELGCHVLVEKPLATCVEDCDRIAAAARKTGKVVGVDHAMLRDPFVAAARNLVHGGAVGDVVSVDYVRSQAYPPYPGGPLPLHYREGGYPFRDMGVHALYLVEAFLGDIEDVTVRFDRAVRPSPAASGSEGDPNLLYSEWRALVRCLRGTGQFHLSWNVKPFQNLLLVQGTHGVIRADLFGMSLTIKKTRRWPEFVQRAMNAWGEGWQICKQVPRNLLRVARKKIVRYHGLQQVVLDFYQALAACRPAPISAEQARPIVYWTERVARQADRAKQEYLARFPTTLTAKILVTGSSGFIGRNLLRRLLAANERVRILVRREPPGEIMTDPRVEVVLGDLGDPEAVDRAVAGTELVYHLGAAVRGSAADFHRGTVVGTRNMVESVLRHRVSKLVYMSSLSVLHAAAAKNRSVQEDWPLEPYPERRGQYTKTKLEAEQIVLAAVKGHQLPAVILRPGLVFGPGGPVLSPAVARRLKNRLVILGNGRAVLPFVFVEDLIDAVLEAAERDVFDGSIFHVVDSATLTQNDFVREYVRHSGERLRTVRLPRLLVYGAALVVQLLGRLLRRAAPLSVYRVRSALASTSFDCRAARERLGWQPRVGVRTGLETTLATLHS